jgi:NADPH-dependent 2,4-dienoyl-CoA reductase/sulfur reductase-like enzyme
VKVLTGTQAFGIDRSKRSVRVFDHTIGRTGMSEKQARSLGLPIETATWAGPDMPHYMQTARPLVIKMIADRRSGRLLGVQVVGMGDGARRLDVAAAAVLFGGRVDQVADIDYAYAPPYSPARSPGGLRAFDDEQARRHRPWHFAGRRKRPDEE